MLILIASGDCWFNLQKQERIVFTNSATDLLDSLCRAFSETSKFMLGAKCIITPIIIGQVYQRLQKILHVSQYPIIKLVDKLGKGFDMKVKEWQENAARQLSLKKV